MRRMRQHAAKATGKRSKKTRPDAVADEEGA
jgi:hypothetical protein